MQKTVQLVEKVSKKGYFCYDIKAGNIVVNYDTDLILPISSYVEAVNMLENDYDVVYPYRFGNHGERKVNLELKTYLDRLYK